jgi:hypothetical protein
MFVRRKSAAVRFLLGLLTSSQPPSSDTIEWHSRSTSSGADELRAGDRDPHASFRHTIATHLRARQPCHRAQRLSRANQGAQRSMKEVVIEWRSAAPRCANERCDGQRVAHSGGRRQVEARRQLVHHERARHLGRHHQQRPAIGRVGGGDVLDLRRRRMGRGGVDGGVARGGAEWPREPGVRRAQPCLASPAQVGHPQGRTRPCKAARHEERRS